MPSQNKTSALLLMEEIYSKGNLSVVDDIVSDDYVYRAPGIELCGCKSLKKSLPLAS